MKKLLLSVAALVLATVLLSLDDSNTVDKTLTQDTNANVEKTLESES
ncbi:hypothetical protein RM697_11430 [Ichthyenterobacterium sp. W332]|uniref:Uncharacterized protein n=1 Tax=Microcosmobacter mediterraneus TaxID=3075607 RepID=A0ABU2YM83_9FLAO|nr:hypothetical protein [Ichthyenterobacterium sp. W332]MDT0559266.1 hypothetical protein [Ichthyenterobacterium sp. W332]